MVNKDLGSTKTATEIIMFYKEKFEGTRIDPDWIY